MVWWERYSTSGRAKISENLGRELNRILNRMPPKAAQSFIFLDAFLASIVEYKEARDSGYLHSRTVSQLLLEKTPGVQAIWYSGMAHENAINLAVRPEIADELFEVVGTTVVKINKIYDFGIYDVSIVRNAKGYDSDGTIIWDS